MLGFPGETEEEFQKSLAFAKEIGFAKVHVFAYSRRPGTRANDAPDQIPQSEKEKRSHQMIEVTQKTREEFYRQQIGLTVPVLFERECAKGVYEGYTENYTPVKTHCGKNICGQIISCRITEALNDYCIAETVKTGI
jgi:threonylcarbamoyladenosine tRNA methylthiotransferase MtaB